VLAVTLLVTALALLEQKFHDPAPCAMLT